MAKVVALEKARIERLAQELVFALREQGYAVAKTADLESVEVWRKAARRAGRILGWRVFTQVSTHGARVICGSEDFPVPPGAHRSAVQTFADLLRVPD